MDLKTEIEILKDNIYDLQGQLKSAQIRIKELLKDVGETNEELKNERQFIQEITGSITDVSKQLETKMTDYMNSIPDVVDSKQQILKEGD